MNMTDHPDPTPAPLSSPRRCAATKSYTSSSANPVGGAESIRASCCCRGDAPVNAPAAGAGGRSGGTRIPLATGCWYTLRALRWPPLTTKPSVEGFARPVMIASPAAVTTSPEKR